MEQLPVGFIANAMSLTTPRDAGRLSTVSSSFKSAAEWDLVWDKFFPEDYRSLVARSSDPGLVERFASKKELFLHLSHNHLLIDGGLKSFSLEKWSGKKSYMLSARQLAIIWGDTPQYWVWILEPNSRFTEVAELVKVCWLVIHGKIKTSMLSKNTLYTAYFVFQLTTRTDGFEYPVDVNVGLVGGEATTRTLHLDNNDSWKEREDECVEIEMGNFFKGDGSEDEELEMCVREVNRLHWKRGLIVYGIEIRPREDT